MPVAALLVFVFLTPLIPRPTVEGAVSNLAPICIISLVVVFAVIPSKYRTSWRVNARALSVLFFVLLVPTIAYGVRLLVQAQWSELSYFSAKVTMSLGILVVYLWLEISGLAVMRMYAAVCWGYFVLGLLMLYVGITGNGVFEAARPSRDYSLPFFKAAGIPRSYGELAIFSTLVLAYLLVSRRNLRFSTWLGLSGLWVLTILIAQSRTGIIAALVVLASYVLLKVFPRRVTALTILVAVMSMPLLAQFAYPALQDEDIVVGVVGQTTYENNVDVRLDLYSIAFSFLTRPGLRLLLLGTDRVTWLQQTARQLGEEVALHNYFLSTFMFFGVIGGAITVIGLLLRPAWLLAATGLRRDDQMVVYLGIVGMLTSLQFYEGFFSLIVMLQIAMLWYVVHGHPTLLDPAPSPEQHARSGSVWSSRA